MRVLMARGWKDGDGMLLMFHDDGCGELLDDEGKCPTCGFHPDMQSTSFRDVPVEELLTMRGRTFLGEHRAQVRGGTNVEE